MLSGSKRHMTPEEYSLYIKDLNKKTDELLAQMRRYTPTIFNENAYVECLQLLSKFHRYSFINVLLIQSQFSSASYICGFETWKSVANETYNDPSYQILQKSHVGKGIKILSPFTATNGENGWKDRRLIYIPVSVYDVSQTNNLVLPEKDPLTLDVIDEYLSSALRSNTPYRFVLADKTNKIIRSGIHSYFDNVNQFIVVDEALSDTARAMEYIRAWAKKEVFDFTKEKNISETYAGFAASSVEYVVRTALMLNTQNISFGYVSQYQSADIKELWFVLHCVQSVSHKIIECLSEDILDMQEMQTNEYFGTETLFDYDFTGAANL